MKLKDRQQLLAVLAIAVVAFFAGDKLLFTPLTRSWKERAARIVDLRKQVANGRQLLQREQGVRRRWEEMRSNTLPTDTSVAEQRLLQAFEAWSQESRISVTSISPQWKHEGEAFVTLDCRVDAFGSLSTVSRFLYNIERDPMGLKLELVELTSRDNEGQQIALGLQLSGVVLNSQAQ
jgi:hypothetical protein